MRHGFGSLHALQYPTKLQQRQDGVTLIELMVGLALGLVVTVALLALFSNVSRTNNEMAKTNSQIENGRFAMQLLQYDLMHAGFWGTYIPRFDDLTFSGAPPDAPTAVPNPCASYATWNPVATGVPQEITNMLAVPLQVYDSVPATCAALITNHQPNTDILLVRRAETCVAGQPNCAQPVGAFYFQSSLCEAEAATTLYVLHTSAAALTLTQRDCVTAAPVRRFVSRIYYVRTFTTAEGDGIPALVRLDFDVGATGTLAYQTAVPVVEGIQGFRVELGIDDVSRTTAAVNNAVAIVWGTGPNIYRPTNRGDGIPDGNFIRCTTAVPCTAAQLSNVVSARAYLLARATQSSPGHNTNRTYAMGAAGAMGPFGDSFKRQVYTGTSRLVNISGRRETP